MRFTRGCLGSNANRKTGRVEAVCAWEATDSVNPGQAKVVDTVADFKMWSSSPPRPGHSEEANKATTMNMHMAPRW